ncbi:hypothetical protein LUX39_43190 [Actinomadura madurae]|nr:hypothetical protein [Actinomadura madurae]MCQ0019736.1 hypothetical protein [Actinomadura madurae]
MEVAQRMPVAVRQDDLDLLRHRPQRPDLHAVPDGMRPEDAVRIVVVAADEPVDLRARHPCHELMASRH